MTFVEKYQIDNPGSPVDDCLMYCPHDFCYEEESICGTMTCLECWDREMPKEEPHG